MERYSNLLSRLEKFEHEIDSLDDDGLLRQSSTRIRDDISVTTHTTARYPTPRRCSPSINEIPEASNPELSSFCNKTPPLPPRPEKPSLFMSECHRTKPMLSKFFNGNNENPVSIGMSTASLFRPINIDNTVDSKAEVKHSDKKCAKPETTVAKTPDRFALSDTTLSAVDNFTVNQQQFKACSPSINEIPEASNPELSSFCNKTPPLPPRPEKPSLFLSECHRTKPMLSKFFNGNNENPVSIGMSTASLFRPINIDNTVDSKAEVKHSDKKCAKPETTVAKTPDRFALSDTTLSAVDNFTVNQQQFKACSPSINEIPEASNPELSSFCNKTPPLPPRPEKPSLFLSECHRTKPMLSKFFNGNNENPVSIGMSTASLFRPINIDNTVDSKAEVKHSDKKCAKPETTVAKTPDRFALSDTTLSAVDNFTVNQQQFKADNDSIQPLVFVGTQNNFQNRFPQENLNNQLQSKNMLSEFSRDIGEEQFQTQTFEPKGMGCSRYQGTHNSRLRNPSSVKYYSQEKAPNLDFDPQQTKQPIELSNTMTNFNQFSENSCQNANNFQTSNVFYLPLHNRQESKNTENKILPGNFTQFQPQSQVNTVGIEPVNPLGVQQIACSKTITESVPIAPSISTFPPKAMPSVEQNPHPQLPPSYQFSSVLNPISNERFKNPSFEINFLPWTSNTAPYWQNPTSKHSIKLPPLTIQNYNGNPLKYHEWINNLFCLVHNNTTIADTHRITYLQNAVTGKAKDVIQAYSCDPAYYSTALNELMSYFGDPAIVVNAFINQLENWKSTNDYNKQNFVAFALFLKR